MKELYMRKVNVYDFALGDLANKINDKAPSWFIHGISIFEESEETGLISTIVYGESEFISDDEILEIINNHGYIDTKESIDMSDIQAVEKLAATQAIKSCVNIGDYIGEFGDILLNKHPEMRNATSPEMAIINAALAERREKFTEEDYNEF